MGTRGFVGFVVDGEEKIGYVQFDSYPTGVGADVLSALRVLNPADLRERAKKLQVVTEETPLPTGDELDRVMKYADTNVGARLVDGEWDTSLSWYQLLRKTQGDIEAMLDSGYVLDGSKFPLDSLFAEWGYVIDFDGDGAFEVYRGFATAPHDKGRFADKQSDEEYEQANGYRTGRGYYPCWLVKSYPLGDLPDIDFLAVEINFIVGKDEGWNDGDYE